MTATTATEKGIILKIFKEFTEDYNSSNISLTLGKTRVGTFKSLKRLEKKGLVKSKKLGRAIFYNEDLEDEYVKKNIEILLMEEAKNWQRWVLLMP